MSFVGGSGNIAIVSARPVSSFVYCCINIFIAHGYSRFTMLLVLKLRFPDVEANPGPRRPVAARCRNSAAMSEVCPGTLVTWQWLCLSMIYCCALRPWSQICGFLGLVALSCCAGASCLVPVGWRHMYEMDMEHFINQNLLILTKMTTYITVY